MKKVESGTRFLHNYNENTPSAATVVTQKGTSITYIQVIQQPGRWVNYIDTEVNRFLQELKNYLLYTK